MALILLPVVASVGFMVLGNSGGPPSVTFATLCFATLAGGVFVALFRMARQWENEAGTAPITLRPVASKDAEGVGQVVPISPRNEPEHCDERTKHAA